VTVVFVLTLMLIVLAWIRGRRRPLVVALGFSAFIVWLGQQGDLSYLGVGHPSAESVEGPVAAMAAAAAANLLFASRPVRTLPTDALGFSWLRTRTASYVAAAVGALLLLARFARFGVPLLSSSRFAAVGSVSPLESLLTAACLVVSVGMLAGQAGRLTSTDKAVVGALFAIVVMDASRLLFLAVSMSLVAGRLASGAWAFRVSSLVKIGVASVVVVAVALPAIYSVRSDDDKGMEVLSARARAHAGSAAPVTKVLGDGSYVSARNGAAVATRILATGEHPPHGYVGGALLHVAGALPLAPSSQDPELYLTKTVFGLDEHLVGNTALPVASAVQADFGTAGCWMLGALVVLGFDLTRRRGPVAASWWSFGVALSAYGMYLLSIQFLGILAGFMLAGIGLLRGSAVETVPATTG